MLNQRLVTLSCLIPAVFLSGVILSGATFADAQVVVGPNIRVNTDTTTAIQVEMIMVADPNDPNRVAVSFKDLRPVNTKQNAQAWSTDGGKSWKDRKVALGNQRVSGTFTLSSDPWMAWWKGGILYDCSLQVGGNGAQSAIFIHRSFDGGASFGPPISAVMPQGSEFEDKQAMTVDNNTGTSRYGSLYISWTRFSSGTPIMLVRSTDKGLTWSSPVQVSDTSGSQQGSVPAVGPNGEVYVAWMGRSSRNLNILFDRSTDGGATWSTDRVIAPYVPWSVPFTGLPTLPAIAVDATTGPHRGTIYVVWAARNTGSDADIFLARSANGGGSWTTTRVNDDNSGRDQFFPHVAVDGAGGVVVSYASRELDPNNTTYDIFVRRSVDGGSSFTPSAQLTDSPSNPARWSQPTANYQNNEYRNVAPSGNHYHAVWTDTRLGDPDVYTTRFSMDLVPDRLRLSARAGGTIGLALAPGPNHRGRAYTLFLSFAGTSPGVKVGSTLVELNPDLWTGRVLPYYGTFLFPGFHGTLSGNGTAQAAFRAPAGLLNSFVGMKLALVGAVHAPLDYATSPAILDIDP